MPTLMLALVSSIVVLVAWMIVGGIIRKIRTRRADERLRDYWQQRGLKIEPGRRKSKRS